MGAGYVSGEQVRVRLKPDPTYELDGRLKPDTTYGLEPDTTFETDDAGERR